jgi:hypothetical protein
VNFLGDADSTGSIAGQIAGALYGASQIDFRLVTNLVKWDDGDTALRAVLLHSLGESARGSGGGAAAGGEKDSMAGGGGGGGGGGGDSAAAAAAAAAVAVCVLLRLAELEAENRELRKHYTLRGGGAEEEDDLLVDKRLLASLWLS